MSATLRLSRSFRIMSATKFTIVLDGQTVGTIANHSSTEVPIDPGPHTVQLVVSKRFTSPAETFAAGDDETIDFVCHARGPFVLAGPWAFVSLLINHSWWIVLKRA
jgi:hypothetical protein